FGGIMGILSYFIMSLMRRRDSLILHLERELEKNLGALISKGEDDDLEFKSSFRYDYRQDKVNKALEMVILKTLAGFMNTRGGSLLIGVADDGSILGLEKDYNTLNRKDSDGYTQLIMSSVADKIGTPACRLLRILFHHQDGKEVCRIIVLPSPTPVYVREDNQSRFFIRTGSGTREMDVAEAIVFIRNKWS
ncbi:MAG: helix-turn-helix domain-containing protein, partial [Syntrophothermus sp.]